MRPLLDLWPEEAVEAMHETSVALLERAGARVESAVAREALAAAGCTLDGERVRVPASLIDEAIAACPPAFVLAARDPERSLAIDGEPGVTYVHNMGGARDIADAHTGAGRRATLRDQAELTRIMHHLPRQHMVTSLVQPGDVPDQLEPLYSFLVLANETDKSVGGPGISHPFQARYLQEMAVALTGADGEGGVYPVDLAFSPVSPLTLGGEVTDALVEQVRRGGVVVEILPCPAMATTAPGSLAGAVSQQNAEVLVGVVLTQVLAAGTPVYYGPRLSAVDPRTGVVVSGTPETGVASMAATLLARRYGLACDCYGPTSDSKVVDAQFGVETALNALLGMAASPRLLSGVGDIQAGVAGCAESLIVDDEVLNYVVYARTPRPWDADALDIEAMVDGVLSGRGFLGTRHTRRYIRSELCTPAVGYRGGLNDWLAGGRSGLADLARERAAEYVAREPVGLPADVAGELCRLIDEAAREVGLGEWPDPRRILEPPA